MSTHNIGVNGYSSKSTGVSGASGTGYGVRGSSRGSHRVVGRTYGNASFDFYAESNNSARNYGSASSIRWKKNIVNIPNALDKLSHLRGVYFD